MLPRISLLLVCLILILLQGCGAKEPTSEDKTVTLGFASLPKALVDLGAGLGFEATIEFESDGKKKTVTARGSRNEEGKVIFSFKDVSRDVKETKILIQILKGENLLLATWENLFQWDGAGVSLSASEQEIQLADPDGDGISTPVEVSIGTNPNLKDSDGDGCLDPDDAFPTDVAECLDTDKDGKGNNADLDDDEDGLPDLSEIDLGSKPLVADTDKDGVRDGVDNCLLFANQDQLDTDGDRDGDVCDTDDDADGIPDSQELIVGTNPLKSDTDGDGLRDKKELDTLQLAEKYRSSPLASDSDKDGTNDAVDVFPGNPIQYRDTDGDGLGDDRGEDNCPNVSNAGQENHDPAIDGVNLTGDACDEDDDGDGLSDARESELTIYEKFLRDTDGDGLLDGEDNCPAVANADQADVDRASEIALYGYSWGAACDFDDREPAIGGWEKAVFVTGATGSDTSAGAPESPLATLQVAARLAAQKKKDIYVAAGTYDFRGVVLAPGLDLYGGFQNGISAVRFKTRNYRSKSSEFKTELTRSDDATVQLTNTEGEIRIDGFFITNRAVELDPTSGVQTVLLTDSKASLTNNTISRAADAPAVSRIVLVKISGGKPILDRNWIEGGTSDDQVIGVHLFNTSAILKNSVILAGGAAATVGIWIDGPAPLLVNNIIDGTNTSVLSSTAKGLVLGDAVGVRVVNNVILTSSASDQLAMECRGLAPGAGSEFRNNLFAVYPLAANAYVKPCSRAPGDTNVTDGFDVGTGATVANNTQHTNTDPAKSDPIGQLIDTDRRLLPGGIGVNAAYNASDETYGSVTLDYLSTARPVSAAAGVYDIGAYEQ